MLGRLAAAAAGLAVGCTLAADVLHLPFDHGDLLVLRLLDERLAVPHPGPACVGLAIGASATVTAARKGLEGVAGPDVLQVGQLLPLKVIVEVALPTVGSATRRALIQSAYPAQLLKSAYATCFA